VPWWWEEKLLRQLQRNAGFYPANVYSAERFSELMLRDAEEVDLLGSWLPEERLLQDQLRRAVKVDLELLNPYFSKTPWTHALEGKKVLVVHPFAATIQSQYLKRRLLFPGNLLPEFDLKTIKAVQSSAGEKPQFANWFEALDSMAQAMDREDYDICLLGCGAYGFPLAAHAKRRRKKAVHMGGALQLLFGIRGRRWESPDYSPVYDFSKLMNEHWVRPSAEETPAAAGQVEEACY
jgi:hypothetical protein